jgi:hypothetical protein
VSAKSDVGFVYRKVFEARSNSNQQLLTDRISPPKPLRTSGHFYYKAPQSTSDWGALFLCVAFSAEFVWTLFCVCTTSSGGLTCPVLVRVSF